jgi:hypothetical protein
MPLFLRPNSFAWFEPIFCDFGLGGKTAHRLAVAAARRLFCRQIVIGDYLLPITA